MAWHLYLRKGSVYLPTAAQTEAGFYSDIEPVSVVSVSDSQTFQDAVKAMIAKGNPVIPTPARASYPKPVVLKYAQLKSWSAFERDTLNWAIVQIAGNYQIKPGRRRPEGGWEDDPERIEALPEGTTLDEVAKRVVELVQYEASDGRR